MNHKAALHQSTASPEPFRIRTITLLALLLLIGLPAQAADSISHDNHNQFVVTDCLVTEVKLFGDVLCVEFEGGQRAGSLGRKFVNSINGLSIIRKKGISNKEWKRLVASARAVLHRKAVIAIRDMDLWMIRGGLMFDVPPSKVEIRAFETP